MTPAVQAVLNQIAQEIDLLDLQTVREIAPLLAAAERELARDLARWLATVPNGGERFTAFQLRRALVQVRGALEEIKRIEPAIYATLRRTSLMAGALSVRHVTETLARLGAAFPGSLNPIALNTAAIIARGDKLLIGRHRTAAARYAGQVGRDIKAQLVTGMLKGETVDGLVARLVAHGGPRGHVFTRGMAGDTDAKAEMISEGLFSRYRYWGERLARTEVISAYNVQAERAIADANRQDRGVKRIWNAAADKRACHTCRYLDGQVAEVGKEFRGPSGQGFMTSPAHPHCRCAVCAWHDSWGGETWTR